MNKNEPVCPRDRAPLVQREERASGCRQCGTCGGLFLGAEALARALGHAPIPHDGADARLAAAAKAAVSCPTCAGAMRQIHHKGSEVDVCPACRAVWLDAGEWERLAKPGSTRGSKFGRTVALSGAAAAAALAVGSSAAASRQPQQPRESSAAADIGEGVVETVADVAVDGAVEVVLTFVGDALGSLF